MTEYEFQELLTGIGANTTDLTAVFISIFAAYMICAYTVGKKLNRFQLVAVTFTYSTFELFMVFLTYNNLVRMGAIVSSYYGSEDVTLSRFYLLGPGILILAWLISIIFMMQTRKSPGS